MKEATGELNVTVITIVALAAVATLFYTFIWPMIRANLKSGVCSSYVDSSGKAYVYKSSTNGADQCCPAGVDYGGAGCITAE